MIRPYRYTVMYSVLIFYGMYGIILQYDSYICAFVNYLYTWGYLLRSNPIDFRFTLWFLGLLDFS